MDTLTKREKIFDNIIVPSGTKKEAIKIISRLCATHRLLDESTLEEVFWKREEWDPTGCGDGIAIPHALVRKTNKVQLAVIRFRYPIEWDAFDGKPVSVAFAIIAPRKPGRRNTFLFLHVLPESLWMKSLSKVFESAEMKRKCMNICCLFFKSQIRYRVYRENQI